MKKTTTGTYNLKSLLQLVKFYENNREVPEKVRETMKIGKIDYPQMKILDMGFWEIGFELDKKLA